jgi:hypothetical protein
MRARVVQLSGLDPGELARWQDLADRAIEPNAFLDPRFLEPSSRLRDDARDTRLLFVEDGDELLGVMAFAVVPRKIRGLPVRAVTPRIPVLSEESERWYPLIDPDRASETLEALLLGLSRLDLPGYLDLDCFPADGALNDALFAAAASAGVPIVERGSEEFAFLYPDPTAGTAADPSSLIALDALSTHSRKNFARLLRGLERELGGAPSLIDRGEDPSSIDDFLALQAAGWKGDSTSGGGFAYRVSGREPWFREVTSRFRAAGRLSVHSLVYEQTTLYMAVTYRSGEREFGVQDAYDERFARFRTGTLGRLAVMQRFLSQPDAAQFDPDLNPRYADSTHVYPHRRRFSSYLLATGGALPRSVVSALPVLRQVRDALTREGRQRA